MHCPRAPARKWRAVGRIEHPLLDGGRSSTPSDLRPSPANPTIAQKVTGVAKRARAAPVEVAQPQVVRVPGVRLVKESTRTGVLWCKQPGTPYMCYPQGHVLNVSIRCAKQPLVA